MHSNLKPRLILLLLTVFTFATQQALSQQFEKVPDSQGAVVIRGILTAEWLQRDFELAKEYTGRPPGFTPDAHALQMIRQQADSLQFVVFMGTWCEDSRFVVPRLFFLLDAAGYDKKRLTLIACDRDKKSLGNLTEPFQVKNVPTIIVMRKGKEIGRVVEYGKTGLFDRELGELIAPRP